ncbi:hypothetical protein P280DRAFT_67643 [Massarina eburnea CBS 473.64]|uniref:Uncharacterized protein n=1 Tax=Massarina eburnea CBS 473.64 TaxID=1395130 RepID=A0A6A6RYA7_9PLEO|nr:hypothetical protein P280DRAFT_67643 [Massarina eburnea CBS 473.64]
MKLEGARMTSRRVRCRVRVRSGGARASRLRNGVITGAVCPCAWGMPLWPVLWHGLCCGLEEAAARASGRCDPGATRRLGTCTASEEDQCLVQALRSRSMHVRQHGVCERWLWTYVYTEMPRCLHSSHSTPRRCSSIVSP